MRTLRRSLGQCANDYPMYDIRQFIPTLYLTVLLGIAGFSLAAETPGLWVLGTLAVMLNAWLVWSDRFRPLPRFVSSSITILALLYCVHEVLTTLTPVLVLSSGQFLVPLP